MIKGNLLNLPDRQEYIKRKKALEKKFIEDTCESYGLDSEKAQYAIAQGILILEPSFFDWQEDEWAKGSIEWAEGFSISCLARRSVEIHIPEDRNTIERLIEKISLLNFTKKLINSLF